MGPKYKIEDQQKGGSTQIRNEGPDLGAPSEVALRLPETFDAPKAAALLIFTKYATAKM
jgi:hypothetical protein